MIEIAFSLFYRMVWLRAIATDEKEIVG